MLCKRTYKNQITIPKKVMEEFDGIEYFEARIRAGTIVLEPVAITPLKGGRLEKARMKIVELGLTDHDLDEAIEWARRRKTQAPNSATPRRK